MGCICFGGSLSQCPWRQRLACEGVCDGGPTPFVPLNSGASFPRQTPLPPGAFLAVELLTHIPSGCLHAAEVLTPIPSSCLCTANSSPHPGSALLTPCLSTHCPPALADTYLRLELPGLTPKEALSGAASGPAKSWAAKGDFCGGSAQTAGACTEEALVGVMLRPL